MMPRPPFRLLLFPPLPEATSFPVLRTFRQSSRQLLRSYPVRRCCLLPVFSGFSTVVLSERFRVATLCTVLLMLRRFRTAVEPVFQRLSGYSVFLLSRRSILQVIFVSVPEVPYFLDLISVICLLLSVPFVRLWFVYLLPVRLYLISWYRRRFR